jgi:TetR/AcrR family transcriptional regulator, mexJK operon transcriptional repressor
MGHEPADAMAEKPARRGGRPTREEAARRDERLIDVATALFMERGFDGTSIDAVAEVAGVSKPTVYARYRDKRELFVAVLRRRIQGWLAPLSAAAEAAADTAEPHDVAETLDALSRTLLCHATAPEAVTLKRILVAQATQFPELAELAYEEGWLRGIRAIAAMLETFAARGRIEVDDPEMAADLFLSLLLGRSTSRGLYGIPVEKEAQERRRRAAVSFFLKGVGAR